MRYRELRSATLGVLIVLGTFLSVTLPSRAQTDPLTAARFAIVIDGYEVASFSELVGIRSGSDDVLEINGGRLLLPRSRTLPTVVLKRGLSNDMSMAAWHDLALTNSPASRKSCSLVMYDAEGKPVARYHLENAWPAKLEIGALKAGASEVLLETVTIVADRILRLNV